MKMMIDSFIKAQLISLTRVKVIINTTLPCKEDIQFLLHIEGEVEEEPLQIIKFTGSAALDIYELLLPRPYQFGKIYSLTVSNFASQVIDVSNAVFFPEFDLLFNYDGDDLGATYTKENTKFALWAPLSNGVFLHVTDDPNKDGELYRMERTDKGVYRFELPGDNLNKYYRYIIGNNGTVKETPDPYGKGSGPNGLYSGIVDTEAILKMANITPKNEIPNYVDAIIYEVGVRDFTEQTGKCTNIVNRGKYLGMIEEGRKTTKGNPAGIDLLKYLGVTHVQLNPVLDFGSVDELNVDKQYNWGYDPISMFVLEGSYSLHPEIPQCRLEEFKTMVNGFHKANIRVNIDVVYNHIYNMLSSCYEKVLPNYFFRRRADGLLSNASGCGDDVRTERYMVRKMIVDSMSYLVKYFDIDGFRFDLMGLIDIPTLRTGFDKCKSIKQDLMFYGEGWNMGAELPFELKACSDNAWKLPEFAFFNESVRDIVKGPTFQSDIKQKGYINGDLNYQFGLKYVLTGSVVDISYKPKYVNANQSLNYIECHDNNTLYDKLLFSNPDEPANYLYERVALGNALLLTIMGIPFIHMGQIIGLSKNGNDNTYNVLDVNKMRWDLLDERFYMVKTIKELIELRKSFKLFSLYNSTDISNAFEDIREDNGLFLYKVVNPDLIKPFKRFMVGYNPTNEDRSVSCFNPYRRYFDENGFCSKQELSSTFFVKARSFAIYIEE